MMSGKAFVTLALFVFASLFAFVFWSSFAAPPRAPPAIATQPPQSSLSSRTGGGRGDTFDEDEPPNNKSPQQQEEDRFANPTPSPPSSPTHERHYRDPKFDAEPSLFFAYPPPRAADGQQRQQQQAPLDDAALLASAAAKRPRDVRPTRPVSKSVAKTTDPPVANLTATENDGGSTRAAAIMFDTSLEQTLPRYGWKGWVLVPRIQAEGWWSARFGPDWSCGVANRIHKVHLEAVLSEITAYAAKHPQHITGTSTWALPHITWDSPRLLYDLCAPRAAHATQVQGLTADTPAGQMGLASITRPSLGVGCLRALMVLDRRAPSLEVAMSRRCFRKKRAVLETSAAPSDSAASSSSSSPSSSDALASILNSIPTFAAPFVVGLGHSHTRYLLAMLCMSAQLSWCGDFDSIQRLPYYPKDVRDVFGVAPSFRRSDPVLARMRELQNDRNALLGSSDDSISQFGFPAMKLAYVSSYYDQRAALVRLLAWLAASASSDGTTGALVNEDAKAARRAKLDFSSAASFGLLSPEANASRNSTSALALDDENDNEHGKAGASTARDSDREKKGRMQQDRLDAEILQWARMAILPKLKKAPTHFVLSRGEWDMLYFDPDPWMLMHQMERGLALISQMFPSAMLILQLPQVHVPIVPHVGDKGRSGNNNNRAALRKSQAQAQWRNRCSSDMRRLLLRHINICAAYRNLKRDQQQQQQQQQTSGQRGADDTGELEEQMIKNSNGSGVPLRRRLIFFDSDRITKSHVGHTFVDLTGHHYIDEALEVLTLELRRIVERPDVAANYARRTSQMLFSKRSAAAGAFLFDEAESSSSGEASCAIVKKAAREFRTPGSYQNTHKLFAKCTCHRDEPADPLFCSKTKILSRDAG